jgi:hypothetical protein
MLIFIYIKIKRVMVGLTILTGYIGLISIWFKLITKKKKNNRILIILAFISAQNPLSSLLHALHKHIDNNCTFFYIYKKSIQPATKLKPRN